MFHDGKVISKGDVKRMKLDGHKIIPTSPANAYRLLTDPQVLVRTMPGLKSMTPKDDEPKVYKAELEMGVAAIKGKYQGEMRMEDMVEGASYRLRMHGQGPGGFVDVNMAVSLEPIDAGSDLHYLGDANVGGTVAGVGQRVLSGVANIIIGQFFTAMAKEAANLSSQ
jgi:hypothetical protein